MRKLNHVYEVYTVDNGEDIIVDILRFASKEDAAEFEQGIVGDYQVRPHTMSAAELVDYLLDFKDDALDVEYIGQVGVDSGMLMITDPCYVKEATEDKCEEIYKVTDNEFNSGQILNGLGFALQTGDGIFEVNAKRKTAITVRLSIFFKRESFI